MPQKNNTLRVCIDVDETLWDNHFQTPRKHIVALYHILKKLGCHITVWSAGGERWAREVCEKCNIHPHEICDKPPYDDVLAGKKFCDISIDDSECLGTVNIYP